MRVGRESGESGESRERVRRESGESRERVGRESGESWERVERGRNGEESKSGSG